MESKIVDRIKKLLALSKSNNVNEAANAASAAARLMEEHELSMADVESVDGKQGLGEILQGEDTQFSYKQASAWRGRLAVGVGDGFGCYSWWQQELDMASGQRVVRLIVLGRRANVDTFRYMFAYLEREVQRLAMEGWAVEIPRPLAAAATRWRNSFMLGAGRVISDRLREQRTDFIAHGLEGAGNSTALIRVQQGQTEVDNLFTNVSKKLGLRSSASSHPKWHADAYEKGKEAGSQVNLGGNQALGTAAKQLR